MPDTVSDDAMRSIDLEYHNIDPSKGLYFALEREHPEMRPISNQTIGHYINNPPRTTRAWMRGSSLTMVEEARSHGIPLAVTPDWGHVSVSVGDKGTSTVTIAMNDPRHPYTEKYARLRKKLGL